MPTFLFINVPKVYSNYNNRTAIQMLLNKEGVGWSKQCILKMSIWWVLHILILDNVPALFVISRQLCLCRPISSLMSFVNF